METAQTLLTMCVTSLVITAIGGGFCYIAWKAYRTGTAPIRWVAIDRAKNPSMFGITIFLYLFGGGSFLCFALLIVGSMGLYVIEKMAGF